MNAIGSAAARVLVVEDDAAVRRMVCTVLASDGYACSEAVDAAAARRQLVGALPDVVLLDWMLGSGASGIGLLQWLRADSRCASLPVILLSARGEENDRVLALDSGADDYMVKPFRSRELRARIRAVLRRACPASDAAPSAPTVTLRLDGLELQLDPGCHELRADGRSVSLRSVEFRLLQLLASAPGQVFSRAELGAQLGLRLVVGGDRAVDVHISRLRRALQGLGAGASSIATHRGVGYQLQLDTVAEADDPAG